MRKTFVVELDAEGDIGLPDEMRFSALLVCNNSRATASKCFPTRLLTSFRRTS
jgi:hypothetical protein